MEQLDLLKELLQLLLVVKHYQILLVVHVLVFRDVILHRFQLWDPYVAWGLRFRFGTQLDRSLCLIV